MTYFRPSNLYTSDLSVPIDNGCAASICYLVKVQVKQLKQVKYCSFMQPDVY